MLRKKLTSLAVAVATGVLLTACGSDSSDRAAPLPPGGNDFDGTFLAGTAKDNGADMSVGDLAPEEQRDKPIAHRWVQLSATQVGGLDPVVVNGAGLPLYRFDEDTANPPKSNCTDDCTIAWSPVVIADEGKVFLDGVDEAAVGVVERDDGSLQLTLNGTPLYRFAKDDAPGELGGQGVDGTWFGVSPDGQKAPGDPTTGEQADEGSVTLFDEPGLFGPESGARRVSGTGCVDVEQPGTASAIQVTGPVEVWSEKNCQGEVLVIDDDILDLAKVNFDDLIASIRFGGV